MKIYQTLSLIGCILGILMTLGLFITMSTGSNISESLSSQRQAEFESVAQPFMTGLAFAFILYIIVLVLTFVIRNTVTIGIILLALGGISVPRLEIDIIHKTWIFKETMTLTV